VTLTLSSISRQELRTEDGKVFACFVTAEDLHRLETEAMELKSRLARLEKLRDFHEARIMEILRTHIPLPPSEDELRNPSFNSNALSEIFSDMHCGDL